MQTEGAYCAPTWIRRLFPIMIVSDIIPNQGNNRFMIQCTLTIISADFWQTFRKWVRSLFWSANVYILTFNRCWIYQFIIAVILSHRYLHIDSILFQNVCILSIHLNIIQLRHLFFFFEAYNSSLWSDSNKCWSARGLCTFCIDVWQYIDNSNARWRAENYEDGLKSS